MKVQNDEKKSSYGSFFSRVFICVSLSGYRTCFDDEIIICSGNANKNFSIFSPFFRLIEEIPSSWGKKKPGKLNFQDSFIANNKIGCAASAKSLSAASTEWNYCVTKFLVLIRRAARWQFSEFPKYSRFIVPSVLCFHSNFKREEKNLNEV